jgi:hypothetical protein
MYGCRNNQALVEQSACKELGEEAMKDIIKDLEYEL